MGEPETSVEWLCANHADRVGTLFDQLDLGRSGMEEAKEAVRSGDFPAACRALLTYYRDGRTVAWLREPQLNVMGHAGKDEEADGDDPLSQRWGMDDDADAILADGITQIFTPATVPRLPNGGLDWSYNGPNDELEWGWHLNRHAQLRILFNAHRRTGNPAYIRCCDEHIRDWVLSCPYPARESSTPQWRGLEVALRVRCWAETFYGLQQVDEFTPAARILSAPSSSMSTPLVAMVTM